MDSALSHDCRYGSRTDSGRVTVWPLSPGRNKFALRLDVVQDIRCDQEEQVAWWCAFRYDCRAARFWNLFHYQGRDGPK